MPNTFSSGDPGYKHAIEVAVKKIQRFLPAKSTAELIYSKNPVDEYQRLVNIGTIKEFSPWTGSGVPALATVPTGGTAGEFYFRTDTPGTASQRIYACTVSGTPSAIGTFVAVA